MKNARLPVAAAIALLLASAAGSPPAHGQGHASHGQAPSGPAPAGSTRISMEALHAAGGVPPGWRFSLPPGNPAAGRQAFIDLKCYACHAIQGEQFPLKPGEAATAGPDLTGMGRQHPTEFLVESILNPSAVLVEGPGFIGGDGRSIMPASPDMTAAQLVDLIAYLKAEGAGEAGHARDGAREQTAGGYRIRLVYRMAPAADHAQHQHGGAAPGSAKDRLLAFVADAASGQPVPYVPVTARIKATGKPVRIVKLAPAMGEEGFHYGADVTLPEKTSRITLSIGPAVMELRPGAPAQLGRARSATFDWK